MAEAHVATAFTFNITNQGFNWNVNYEVLKAILHSSTKSWKKKLCRIKNRIDCGVYPAKPDGWLTMAFIVFIASLMGYDISFGIIHHIENFIHLFGFSTPENHTMASLWFSFLLWFIGVLVRQYTLKALLSYTGWMYESRGKVSTKTKLWHTMLRLFSGGNPKLYSCQGSLPSLPVPKVEDTVNRYLRSVRPLMDDEKYEHVTQLADEFQTTIARKLQYFLVLKSWITSNYVSDWWEKYVYLSGRAPIMINSNFYGLDALLVCPSRVQSARAASITHAMLRHMRILNKEEAKPLLLNNLVPLCSRQYERTFGTTRIPGKDKDHLQQYRYCKHVVVMHKGRYYKVFCYIDHRWLEPCEIEAIYEQILNDKSDPVNGEEYIAALTAGSRVHWYETRCKHFSSGLNKASLHSIESAAFVVALDDEPYSYNPDDPDCLNHFCRRLLHGTGYDRWFDKSFTLVVATNGSIGVNAEHSWADAPVIGQVWETVLLDDAMGYDNLPSTFPNSMIGVMRYKPDGHCRGQSRMDFPGPVRLRWELSDACKEAIQVSYAEVKCLVDDIDLYVVVHNQYGKGFIKTCNLSPDAYIQLALQLAFFRDDGKFCLTYEASMTRLFREGRTETVRSCTNESCEFVRQMENPNIEKSEKIRYMRAAADYHQNMYRDAMTGKGIDRHIFCLYVVSKYLGLESPFLKEVLSEPWRLSTSQTPQGLTDKLDFKQHPNLICGGGGFGPVADDGYGVSYIISGEDVIFFHISCKNSCEKTSAKRFGEQICEAMKDIQELFK